MEGGSKEKNAPRASQPRVRAGGRSARVVAEVLRATAEELARVGYVALRMEDVARAAGVNKTTVYRRWPTKMQLVSEAMGRERELCSVTPDTGSLREDLGIMLRSIAEQGRSPLARAWLSELGNTEVRAIMRGFRHQFESQWVAVIARGMARGELPPDSSPLLLAEVVVAPIVGRLVRGEEPPTVEFCSQVIDLVLAGVLALAACVSSRPRPFAQKAGPVSMMSGAKR
jgi:AcrR family transcriptional regulator